jgi:uncharacterized low-complexity protein
MSKKTVTTPLSIALGAAFVTSLAGTSIANAGENPFSMTQLSSGYMVADSHEGKCGEGKAAEEGKCGGDKAKAEGKCGEGKCGADKAKHEGKCGEGKCGADKAKHEGQCGANK